MTDLREVEARLRDETSGLREAIVRSIGAFTVALFGVFGSGESERLELGGTGTLVTVGNSSYVLTAAHVWEWFVNNGAKGIGLTLKENEDHRFVLNAETIVASGPAKVGDWNEWGPDLTFLRIPPEFVGRIMVYKAFQNLTMNKSGPPNVDLLEMWVLMGAPAVQAVFTQRHADLAINGFFSDVSKRQRRGDFDYVDLDMDVSFPGVPGTFGGVSGGGFWSVIAFGLPDGKVDWYLTLVGVAFYQFDLENNKRVVRCHGQESIRTSILSVESPGMTSGTGTRA
jgi:hypothetical protein